VLLKDEKHLSFKSYSKVGSVAKTCRAPLYSPMMADPIVLILD